MLLEVLDVGGEVGAAALLGGLDEDEDPALAAAGGEEAGDCGEGGIAVVGGAAAVELVAVADGFEGVEALAPGAERRLLVHVPVTEDGIAGPLVVDEEDRGASRQLDDLHIKCCILIDDPITEELGGLQDVPVLGPVGVEGG